MLSTSTSHRRETPSQVARAQRGAEANTTKQKKQASEQPTSPSGLFLPTPPSLFYNIEGNKSVDALVRPSVSVNKDSTTCRTHTVSAREKRGEDWGLWHADKGCEGGKQTAKHNSVTDSESVTRETVGHDD